MLGEYWKFEMTSSADFRILPSFQIVSTLMSIITADYLHLHFSLRKLFMTRGSESFTSNLKFPPDNAPLNW